MPEDMYGGGDPGGGPMSDADMAEDAGKSPEEYPSGDIPLNLIGDKQPGETETFKILSRDEDSGTATVQCQRPEGEMPAGGSIRKAAAMFGEEE